MWQWLSELQGAQASLLGSFAGFLFGICALVVGALVNFRLNRRRDALLRGEEADSVAAALYGEIVLIRKELARTANIVAKTEMRGGTFDKHFLELTRLQEPLLYKALANKLGLLAPEVVLAITDFHGNVELARGWLPQLVESDDRKFSYSPLTVLEPAIKAIDGVKPTLDHIAKTMRIGPPEDDFDLSNPYAIAENEREKFGER
ncbi:hypothetical protein [Mesorhizobium sp.]|uniref:hypothetical protein n=1 Tax=Mesorhizobium sp. TaxID=1871066 RepID=UPI0012230504|nr:hypothetical protein [Mesorhizobium sp.]TIL28375.1 MAG: hypothetical protein E5Y85_33020 [Mesorhizobium sp.]TIL48459.1 MAG: hypothetical protein E5Y83_31105 [Mesorhizobium sp.]TIL86734.1 MAG: hypothetical protein E5Y73_26745 [Mesorhizobium sp.]